MTWFKFLTQSLSDWVLVCKFGVPYGDSVMMHQQLQAGSEAFAYRLAGWLEKRLG